MQSDEEATFTDFTEVVAFIQKQLAKVTLDAIPTENKNDQVKILRESFRLWEQFAQSYSNLIFDALESNMKQSRAFREQVDEALKQISSRSYLSSPTDQKLAFLIAVLGSQLEALEKKVEQLDKAS